MQDRASQDVEGVFASKLRETREAAGLSQARLAALLAKRAGLDLDPTAITRIERGQRRITLGEAQALASVLGVPLEYLCTPGPVPVSTLLERRLSEAEAMLGHYKEMSVTAARGRQEAQALIAELQAELAATRNAQEREAGQRVTVPSGAVIVGLHDYDSGTGQTVIHVYGELREISKAMHDGRPVVFDLRGMREYVAADAANLADRLAPGAAQRSIERIDAGVFVLKAPRDNTVSASSGYARPSSGYPFPGEYTRPEPSERDGG